MAPGVKTNLPATGFPCVFYLKYHLYRNSSRSTLSPVSAIKRKKRSNTAALTFQPGEFRLPQRGFNSRHGLHWSLAPPASLGRPRCSPSLSRAAMTCACCCALPVTIAPSPIYLSSMSPADLRDPSSLDRALKGVKRVFHVAADYRLWAKRSKDIYESNVGGTKNLLAAAGKRPASSNLSTHEHRGHHRGRSPAAPNESTEARPRRNDRPTTSALNG